MDITGPGDTDAIETTQVPDTSEPVDAPDNTEPEDPSGYDVPGDTDEVTDAAADGSANTASMAETEEDNNVTTLVFEADTYTVTAVYGLETGIPSDCELVVSEIYGGDVYNEYMDLTTEALSNIEINRVRFFDITLIKDGIEYEPYEGTTVSVRITLNEQLENEVSVVHISDDSEASVVDMFDVTDAESGEGTEVTFNADGFSAYAIVEGPSSTSIQTGWRRIESRDKIPDHLGEIYIGSLSSNKYFTNEQYYVSGNSGRSGIKKTETAQPGYPSEDAAAYVFEPAGADDQYYIYTVKSGVPNYIKQNGNSLSLETDKTKATVFTFSDLSTSDKTFQAMGGTSGYFINQHGDKIVFGGLDEDTNYTVTEDPLGYQSMGYLNGNPVSTNGTVSGNTKTNKRVLFVNTREALIPTGVDTSLGICLSFLAVAVSGWAVMLVMSGKHRREELCSGASMPGRSVRRPSKRDIKKLKDLFS